MQTGVYQHFKGGLYYVVGVGKHSETQEELVIYRNGKGEHWLRPVSMFTEEVTNGTYTGPRFKLVLKSQMSMISPEALISAANDSH